jgi:MFS family permease
MNNIAETISGTLIDALNSIIAFIPNFIAGLVILIIGWIIAALLRAAARKLMRVVQIRRFMERVGVESEGVQETWVNIIAQVIFWGVFIFFLIPTFEAWAIPQVNVVLNQLLLYLPSVIAAVIIGFLGFVFSNLLAQIVDNATKGYKRTVSNLLSGIARYSILFFTALIVLEELGIASALIQILLTGIMMAIALALGLAFGLGGRDSAGRILERIERGSEEASKKIRR